MFVSYPPGILSTQTGLNQKKGTPLTPSSSLTTRCAKKMSRGDLIILPLLHRYLLILSATQVPRRNKESQYLVPFLVIIFLP